MLQEPYSPKRVQVFSTNSKGTQGGRPETQDTAKCSGRAERLWQTVQHLEGPGISGSLHEGAAIGSIPCSKVLLDEDTDVCGSSLLR